MGDLAQQNGVSRTDSLGEVTVHLTSRRLLEGGNAVQLVCSAGLDIERQDRKPPREVCDKGKPGESRRRKAPRLKRAEARHASRAADSHY
jgi:hypothetical protein